MKRLLFAVSLLMAGAAAVTQEIPRTACELELMVAALGVHGQFIYINSDANVVIAKQTSDPDAESFRVDTETALMMHVIADHLQQ